MRRLILLTTCLITLLACSKQSSTPSDPGNSNPSTGTGSGSSSSNPAPTSSITVSINGTPMTVTGISRSRSSGSFNFSAWNQLQKVDIYCFHFYEPNRWNYQYSDSINYSSRPDSLADWFTVRAINYGDVSFDCCAGPLQDSLITGSYKGTFYRNGKEELDITGTFKLLF